MKITRWVFGGYGTLSEVNVAVRISADDKKMPLRKVN